MHIWKRELPWTMKIDIRQGKKGSRRRRKVERKKVAEKREKRGDILAKHWEEEKHKQ